MSSAPSTPSAALRAGRRGVDGIAQVEIIHDLAWHERASVWLLHVRIHLDVPSGGGLVPAATDWWIHIDPHYPLGRIKIYPAKVGGIRATFPHQSHNSEGDKADPWRHGDLCLDSPYASSFFGRNAPAREPADPHWRLHWHVTRAKEWVGAAAAGTLLPAGDRFELPAWNECADGAADIVFSENALTFRAWEATRARAGVAEIAEISERYHAVTSWFDLGGRPILQIPWGHVVSRDVKRSSALWVRLPRPPILSPWQAPGTWGELRRAAARSGTDLDAMLRQVIARLRGRERAILLVGFPIPERVGEPESSMWWKPVEMPALKSRSKPRARRGVRARTIPKGYRDNALGRWMRDRLGPLCDPAPLRWAESENWSSARIGARGRYMEPLRKSKIAVIGSGALGSLMADLLVRGGAEDMRLIDGDELAIGNLARHRLSIDSLGEKKATALAEALVLASPHARVEASPRPLPLDPVELRADLGDREIILDCTGDDAPLAALSQSDLPHAKLFVSISVGWRARLLYFYASRGARFQLSDYAARVGPWLEQERRSFEPSDAPWEGAGCWHPSWPGRLDDLMLMAATASKLLEAEVAVASRSPKLQVFTRVEGEDGVFQGVRRLETPG